MAILQSVLQKFSRKANIIDVDQGVRSLSHKISNYAPLFELQEKRQLIEVISDRTGEVYQSMILAVDLNREQIELDELFPQPADFIYQPGDSFTVKHHHRGLVLSFSCKLNGIAANLSSPIYTLELPERVDYEQRRRFTRLTLSKQQPLSVRLQSPRRTPWYATANNISAGGMRLVIGGNILDQLQHNTYLPELEFRFNTDFQVRCQARVKGFRFLRRPYRHTELSIEFKDMAPQHRGQLAQLIESFNASVEAA
jgi:c-di-GMP-binding flagellar brake protein YcgR